MWGKFNSNKNLQKIFRIYIYIMIMIKSRRDYSAQVSIYYDCWWEQLTKAVINVTRFHLSSSRKAKHTTWDVYQPVLFVKMSLKFMLYVRVYWHMPTLYDIPSIWWFDWALQYYIKHNRSNFLDNQIHAKFYVLPSSGVQLWTPKALPTIK